MTKYVKLSQVEALLLTLDKRDRYDYWNTDYQKQQIKLEKSINHIRKNAVEFEVNHVQS